MVDAAKLVYDTRRKLNATISGTNSSIPLVDYIAAINEAQEIWFTNLVQVAETESRVRDDLRFFELKRVELTLSAHSDGIVRAKLPSDYYKRLNQVAICSKDCCPGITKEIIIDINQSDDINETNRNPFRRANFEYEQLNGDEAGDYLLVYHLDEMNVDKVLIDYYRVPNEIHAPSLAECDDAGKKYYDYSGRAITEDAPFEPSNRFADQRISDIAAIILSVSRDDYETFQSKLNSVLALGQIYQT
jgi:hypothetical protein